VDTLVRKLSLAGKKTAAIVSNLMMIGCCTLMFYGTFKQHGINASTRSAVTEIPMIWVYGVGYVASIAMALILVGKLARLIRGDISEDELVQVKESEEVLAAHNAEVKR
jgi:TRAP-type C4-dicarboxylate transport system permease small subunit